MNFHYVNAQRQPTGPVTRGQLDELVQQGTINAETLVVKEGDKSWITYRQLDAPSEVALVPPQPLTVSPPSPPVTPPTFRPPTAAIGRQPAAPIPAPMTAPATAASGGENMFVASFTHPVDLGQRLIAIGGAAAFVAFFLPWVQSDLNSNSIRSYSGWFAATDPRGFSTLLLIPTAAIAAIFVAGKLHHANKIDSIRLARIPMIVGAVMSGIALFSAFGIESFFESVMRGFGEWRTGRNPPVTVGFGLWLTAIAFIAQVVGAWMTIEKRTE